MTTLEGFATAYDLAEQLNCWPGEPYTGDSGAWDAWTRTASEPSPDDLATLDAISQGTSALMQTHQGGVGPAGQSRIWTGEAAGYEYFSLTTQSTSGEIAVLRFPDGHVVARDPGGNTFRFSAEQFAAMPCIESTRVDTDDDEDH